MEFEAVVWQHSYAAVSAGVGNELDAAPFFMTTVVAMLATILRHLRFASSPMTFLASLQTQQEGIWKFQNDGSLAWDRPRQVDRAGASSSDARWFSN